MTAAIDMIGRSMRRAGILAAGETPHADETSDVLAVLNGILEQWSIDGLTVYARREIVFTGTGAGSYTIGPAGDVVADRPDMIDAAFYRLGNSDAPIDIIGDDTFSRIGRKQQKGAPSKLRYWPTMPEGRVDLWPTPDSSYEIHLIVSQPLERVEHTAQDIVLAPGYDRALFLTLAVDLCVEFQRSIPTGLPELMNEAVASVRRANINNQPDQADFDPFFGGSRRCNFLNG